MSHQEPYRRARPTDAIRRSSDFVRADEPRRTSTHLTNAELEQLLLDAGSVPVEASSC